MRSLLLPSLVLAGIAALPGSAPAAPARGAAFDPVRVHADYQAGEFEKVIRALESFRESGLRCRKADSVFLEKHLAVVYAADPGTRERGRYHMLRMLALEPEADLLDMFVGEEVDGIFEKVRKESRLRLMAQAKPSAGKASQAARTLRAAPGATQPTIRVIAQGTIQGSATRTPAASGSASAPAALPARGGKRTAVPAALRAAYPEPGPAPRLKPWNLDPAPSARNPSRKSSRPPARSRAAATAEPVGAEPEVRLTATASSGRSHPQVPGYPRSQAIPAPALPAWDLDRTASSGPALGIPAPAGGLQAFARAQASRAGPAGPASAASASPEDGSIAIGSPEGPAGTSDGPRPRWKDKRLWVGGTAVAAVLGLTAYYVGSQDWSEGVSKSRTYGVAAKPNAN